MKKSLMTLATFLVAAKMTEEAFDAQTPEEQAKAFNEINENNIEYIKELKDTSVSKEELTEAIAAKNAEVQAQYGLLVKTMNTLASIEV